MMRGVLIGILALMAGAVAWLSYDWYRTAHGGEPYGAPFALVDQNGGEITEAAFRGQPTAVFFGFTHCPEVCPTTLYELDGWLQSLGRDGEAMRAYFVSVDPERDTPDVLAPYVGNVSDRVTGITGDPEKVAAMTRAFGIYSKKVPLEGDDYTVDHTASIILLDRNGRFFGTIAYGENADSATAKLRRLAREG
jgi:protein SCO1